MFSCKFCETFKNTFVYRLPLVATSETTARFLKYVWPFYNMMHERVNPSPQCCISYRNQPFDLISSVYNIWVLFPARDKRLFHIDFKELRNSPLELFLWNGCSENMQQIYRRTPVPKCDFSQVAKHLYWNRTSGWVLSCKFAPYFQITFS